MSKNFESPTTTKICWLGRTANVMTRINILKHQWPFVSIVIKKSNASPCPAEDKAPGFTSGLMFSESVLLFYTLVEGFFRSHSGHTGTMQEDTGVGASAFLFFLFFLYIFFILSPPQPPWLASWVQAATENSPDVQPESKQRAAGVVSCKTSPAVPLISRDRERGGRGGEQMKDGSQTQITPGGAGHGGVSM